MQRPRLLRAGSFDPFCFADARDPFAEDADRTAAPGAWPAPALLAGALVVAALPPAAWAKGGEFGLAEGRIVSLAHPTVMGVCFLVSLASLYTGFQWRRVRELQVRPRGPSPFACLFGTPFAMKCFCEVKLVLVGDIWEM